MVSLYIRRVRILSVFLMIFFLLPGCRDGQIDQKGQVLFGLALEGLPTSASFFHELEMDMGLPVTFINFFLQWPEDPKQINFPAQTFKDVHDFGAVPVLTWEPMYYEGMTEHMIPADEILRGRYDGYIEYFAGRIKDMGKPVIVRFAHEMNLSRYHWGGTIEEYGPESPKRYAKLFRHVVEVFRQQGAENALFAFCPNNESVPSPKYDAHAYWNTAQNYYPGDDYVDILGMDGYNWGTTRTIDEHGWSSRWLSFAEIFQDIFLELRQINPGKPLYVFETASVRQGGDWQAWVWEAFATAGQWELDGIIWFHADKEEDWRFTGFADSEYYPAILEIIGTGSLGDNQIQQANAN
ncbi:glycoside hydrolase family 26 protein [Desulfonatronovibrio hydrogenovorans]|uniref:glycoside hydrolase family 26 protein n=1 Tax=Desulfonatronovibrio hydrogenovorans TaxID=53245 RepID=UPI000690BAAF|nr:glycosyl hydrolase [Desulfonatronovibrio hydrogenovorans]